MTPCSRPRWRLRQSAGHPSVVSRYAEPLSHRVCGTCRGRSGAPAPLPMWSSERSAGGTRRWGREAGTSARVLRGRALERAAAGDVRESRACHRSPLRRAEGERPRRWASYERKRATAERASLRLLFGLHESDMMPTVCRLRARTESDPLLSRAGVSEFVCRVQSRGSLCDWCLQTGRSVGRPAPTGRPGHPR